MNTKPGTGYTLNMTGNDGGAPPSGPIADAYGAGFGWGQVLAELFREIHDETQRIKSLIETQTILKALASSALDEQGQPLPASCTTAMITQTTGLINGSIAATIRKRNNMITLSAGEFATMITQATAAIAATENPILRAKKTQRT
jgi:hypothetical protein